MRQRSRNKEPGGCKAALVAGVLAAACCAWPAVVLAQSCTWDGTPSVAAPVSTSLRSQRTLHRSPGRIAVDAQGNVYTTEPAAGRVVVTNPFGGVVDVRDGFLTPSAIAIDPAGNIYVGERETGSISVFDGAWNLSHRLGQGAGEFVIPSDIAIDPDFPNGAVYVADGGADVVRAYSPSGAFQIAIGGAGSSAGQFDFPAAVYMSGAGELFVSDHNNDRVQVFDRNGAFLRCFGRKSIFSFSKKFGSVLGLTGDALGRLYVADAFRGHVRVFDAQGAILGTIGSFEEGPGQLRTPTGLVVDPFGRLLVTSVNTGCVQLFGVDAFSDPECGSDFDCPSNDGNPCTVETCVAGACLAGDVESTACGACGDCFDNDRDGFVDSEDPECATLALEASYALLATATGTGPGIIVERQSHVAKVPGRGGCAAGTPYPAGPSRAQLCAVAIEVMDTATLDGAESDPAQCAAARAGLSDDAAYVGSLTVTDETIDRILVPRSAARSPCVGDATSDCPTVSVELGSGLQVLLVDSLEMEQGTQLFLSGRPDTVLLVRVLGDFDQGPRARIVATGGLEANRVLWSVEGLGGDVVLGDGSLLSGTVMAPGRGIVTGARAEVQGALLGGQLFIGSKSRIKHTPFVGLLVP